MDQLDATAYLDRLGVSAEPPSADALARLHRAHVERIPYETFWIHLREGWGIGAAESARRFARTRRGGYCFQQNGALAALLEHLGYRVTRHVAGVHCAATPTTADLGNHVALIVDGCPSEAAPDGRWYVDTGLGDALHEPLPLQPGIRRQGPSRFGLANGRPGRRRRLAPDPRRVRIVRRCEHRRAPGRDAHVRGAAPLQRDLAGVVVRPDGHRATALRGRDVRAARLRPHPHGRRRR